MFKLNILALIFVLSTFLTSYAQTPTWVQQDPKPYIEVTGKAEIEVIPDQIYIGITIKERHEGKTKITVEDQEKALREAIKSLGIDSKNLTLSNVNSRYVRVRVMKKDVINKSEYTLMVKDAETVGKVFDQLEKMTIKTAYIAKVDHTKKLEIKKDMRIQAIKAAKDKAQYLVSAIDQSLGTPLVVREEYAQYLGANAYSNTISQYRGNVSRNVSSSSNNDGALQFRKIKIEASIYLKYEIK